MQHRTSIIHLYWY